MYTIVTYPYILLGNRPFLGLCIRHSDDTHTYYMFFKDKNIYVVYANKLEILEDMIVEKYRKMSNSNENIKISILLKKKPFGCIFLPHY